MAADRSLVEGAYRAAMARGPKDMSKMFMQEGAMISRVAGMAMSAQAKKAQAKKVVDKDLKAMSANLNKVTGVGDKQFEQAGREYFAKISPIWANMDPMQKEREIANTKRMAEEGKDFATTVTDFAKNPDAYKRVEGTLGTENDSTDGRLALLDKEDGYRLSYGENNELMVQFKGDKEAQPWAAWKAKHLKPNTDEADAKFMDGFRKDAEASGKKGGDFDYAGGKQKIIKNLFKDDIDINHFANKENFRVNKDKMGTFKDVLMQNPELQQEVIKNMNENELYANMLARYDIDGFKGFSQSDLDMLMSNERLGRFDKSMGDMVDALTNPKNNLYNTELAQDILGDALVKEVQGSSYKQGTDIYNRGVNQNINRQVESAIDKDKLQTAETFSEQGAFNIRKLNAINKDVRIFIEDVPVMKTVDGKKEQDGDKTEKAYVIKERRTIDGETVLVPTEQYPVEPYGGYSFEDYLDVLSKDFKVALGSKNTNL